MAGAKEVGRSDDDVATLAQRIVCEDEGGDVEDAHLRVITIPGLPRGREAGFHVGT